MLLESARIATVAGPAPRAPATAHAVLGAGPIALEVLTSPLSANLITVRGPEGSTIAELLRVAGIEFKRFGRGLCWIEDADRRFEPLAVRRECWHLVRPKAGTVTSVILLPTGSGTGKLIFRIVGMIAIIAASFFLGPELAALAAPLLQITTAAGVAALSAAFSAVISVVGNLLLSALIPPPQPRAPEERSLGMSDDRSSFTLQGASNRAKAYGKIPIHLGRLKRFADVGAEFFTEIVGNDQYLRFFMPWGMGPLKVTELKLGETPIDDLDGVELRTVEGWADDGAPQIFTNDAHTEALTIQLTETNGWQTRETIEGIDEFQIEFSFPSGLGQINSNGGVERLQVDFAAEMAPSGTESWAAIAWFNAAEEGFGTPGIVIVADATRTGQPRRVGRVKPNNAGNPTKQWRVRTRRTTADVRNPGNTDQSFWVALKSIRYVLPIHADLVGRLAYTEGRIKATGQLNGVLQELNAIVESYVRAFDDDGFLGTWQTPRTNWILSRNNAELYAHAANHWSLPKPIPAGRLAWSNLAEWRDACAAAAQDGAPRWMYDRVLEGSSTLGRVLDEIAACGRARRGMVGGKHGVIRDLPQSVPAQHFTPRNSWGFKTDIVFRRRIHGWRVRYNKDGLGQEAEITVYDDGYNAGNASEFETLEFIGYTREGQVWRDARYHAAVARLRPHSYELGADIEHLKAGRGALVRGTHDVVGWGLASGRLKAVTLDEDEEHATAVALDTTVTMAAGGSYGIRFRNPNGSFYVGVVTVAGETKALTFATPQPVSWGLADGDLWGFGEADRESVELLIMGVVPEANLHAKLMLVDAAPGVHTADTGTIPEFDPQVTRPPVSGRDPEPPAIRRLVSDETAMIQRVGGALVVRILAEFDPPTGLPVPDFIQARWRRLDSPAWTVGSAVPAATLTYPIEAVQQGVTYRVEYRYVTAAGRGSGWRGRDHLVIGKTTLPPEVSMLFATADHLFWPYSDPPLDVEFGGGFRVKFHYGDNDHWPTAVAAHDALLSDPRFPLALLPPGTLTVLVKAVDCDGNESARAARLLKDIGAPATDNIVFTFDYRAEGWPGTIAGGTIVSGDLAAAGQSLFWVPGDALLWGNGGELFWGDDYNTLTYAFSFEPPEVHLPAELSLDIAFTGEPRSIEVRRDDGEPFWGGDPEELFYAPAGSLFWGIEWRAWNGTLQLEDTRTIEFRLAAGSGNSRGIVTALKAHLNVPTFEMRYDDVVLAPGGTRLAPTRVCRGIKAVVATLQDDGGASRTLKTIDKDPEDGPLMRAFDAAGSGTAATIDARVTAW